MTLNDFITSRNKTKREFALEVDASTKAVVKWCRFERYPAPQFMQRIIAATDGLVRPEDFFRGESQ